MALQPDTLDPNTLDDQMGVEVWRRTIKIGDGAVVLLGSYRMAPDPAQGPRLEASITVTSYCCPRRLPVSSVPIWTEFGQEALHRLRTMEPAWLGLSLPHEC